MRCPQCHRENKADASMCRHCGARLEPDVQEDVPASKPSRADLPAWQATALTMFEQGRVIDAIKACRAETGLGLKEAKEAVERLAAEHGLSDVVRRQQRTQTLGCMILAVVGVSLIASFVWLSIRG
ncbi:MAG: ribosomal protein L7/L12 [Pirellulales bacterium]|nr:ribosomal protein L7/L12 [Pirellulales bacterium]